MCTVTFIPSANGFYFTSSRDEKASRKTIAPAIYNHKNMEIVYPKDEEGGGTWIASSLTGKTACLLNGAFVNHQKEKNYKKSRGLILLESFNYKNASEFLDMIDLESVEPFTLITLDYSSGILEDFYEFRWDGTKKYLKSINSNEPQIWSSATLYSPSVQLARKNIFDSWIDEHKDYEGQLILNFHNRKHGLNASDDILMRGEADLMTLSISQIQFKKDNAHFNYYDILNETEHKIQLNKKKYINA